MDRRTAVKQFRFWWKAADEIRSLSWPQSISYRYLALMWAEVVKESS